MKRDMDFVRCLLLAIENRPTFNTDIIKYSSVHPLRVEGASREFSREEVEYHLAIMQSFMGSINRRGQATAGWSRQDSPGRATTSWTLLEVMMFGAYTEADSAVPYSSGTMALLRDWERPAAADYLHRDGNAKNLLASTQEWT